MNENCIFRQLGNDSEEMPPGMATIVGSFPEDEPESPTKVAETLTAMEAPICGVEGCKLSIRGLMRYITNAGNDTPRKELDKTVAPSCAILDVPHATEEILGPYQYPNDPRV